MFPCEENQERSEHLLDERNSDERVKALDDDEEEAQSGVGQLVIGNDEGEDGNCCLSRILKGKRCQMITFAIMILNPKIINS